MMQRMEILAGVAGAMMVCGGLVHGLSTHRWTPNVAVQQAVDKLQTVPVTVGDWTSEPLLLSDAELTFGGIAGYIKREYTNRQTGAQVTLLLVAGDAGPIALHPPTVCFSGRGFHVVGHEMAYSAPVDEDRADAGQHEFLSADFANPADADPSRIRVYWGWSVDGRWQTPDHPRVAFAGSSALYKLYVSERWLPQNQQDSDTGTGRLFLEAVLPQLTQALSPGSQQENP